MAVGFQGKVGPQTVSDGSTADIRLGRSGEGISQLLHGQYYEQTKRGNVYIAANTVAGVAPGTALSPTPPFVLYNQAESGVDLVVLLATLGYVSGTLGAGSVLYAWSNHNVVAAPTSGTPLAVVNAKLGGLAGRGLAYNAPTLPAAPAIVRPFCGLGASLATTAVQPWQIADYPEGSIIVAPGTSLSLQAIAAAGTSPLVVFGVVWEEVPV